MTYLKNAPASLVELHMEQLKGIESRGGKIRPRITAILGEGWEQNLDFQDQVRMSREVKRKWSGLMVEDTEPLLGRLVTDKRMEKVWSSLRKPLAAQKDGALLLYLFIFRVLGKRSRVSPMAAHLQRAEHKAIANCALQLDSLLAQVTQYEHVNVATLVRLDKLGQMLSHLESKKKLQTTEQINEVKIVLSQHLPPFTAQLAQLVRSARSLAESDSEPNFAQAATDDQLYLQEKLSDYCIGMYKRPHDSVVATIVTVALDLPEDLPTENVKANRHDRRDALEQSKSTSPTSKKG